MIYTNTTHQQIPRETENKTDSTLLNQNEFDNTEASKLLSDTTDKSTTNKSADNTDIATIQGNAVNNKFGDLFEKYASGDEQLITINTDNYQAVISNKGGSLVR
jgi:hypothetical protein